MDLQKISEIVWVWVTKSGGKYYGSATAGYLKGKGAPIPETSAIKLNYVKATRGYY